ncbi:MAG: hypothetical protein GC206_09385 [Alphaproteobacteria bacterium]|nr:hypothetical protein [Alphaproteobacteria bacterium]
MAIIRLTAGAALCALIAACSQGYPASVRQEFMTACTRESAAAPMCACTLRGIESEFTLAQYRDWERAIEFGDIDHAMSPRIEAITLACVANPDS